MSDVAIRIENLGKRYRYGGAAPIGDTLRSDLTEWAKGLLRRPDRRPQTTDSRPQPSSASLKTMTAPSPSSSEKSEIESARSGHAICGLKSEAESDEPPLSSAAISHRPTLHEILEEHLAHDPNYFWALKDINLEVRTGEVVGIIGRNGAGKSTLLKILSRITPPTTGRITYNGRIASRLEVGTGFHRELTGRENIFLNGSILGMKRAEIVKKFDEIVAFAEVEKFIDTPVKFYSSGMYVRLAFAVAAHLEPEILIVDEVLAVGDAQFQDKCLGKMSEVASAGRTVLIVSHNLPMIQALCGRAALLKSGKLDLVGTPSTVLRHYSSSQTCGSVHELQHRSDRRGNGTVRITAFCLQDHTGATVTTVHAGDCIDFVVHYRANSDSFSADNWRASLQIWHRSDYPMILCSTEMTERTAPPLQAEGQIICRFTRLPLSAGTYRIELYIEVNREIADHIEQASNLTVEDADFYGTGRLAPAGHVGRTVLVEHNWRVTRG